jgi:hypothetical protein
VGGLPATIGVVVPLASTVGGVVIGSLLNATLTARAAKRDLERTDQNKLLDRIRELELQQARLEGRTTDIERQTP